MTGCINTANQALAAVNSPAVPAFAKATAVIRAACRKECEKYPDAAECQAYAASCKSCAEGGRRVAARRRTSLGKRVIELLLFSAGKPD